MAVTIKAMTTNELINELIYHINESHVEIPVRIEGMKDFEVKLDNGSLVIKEK